MKGWSRIGCLVMLCAMVGCSPIPNKYLRQSETGATLTTIQRNATYYQGKLVVLGGVIMEEEALDGRLWLHVKNRPLDQDYRPQLPPSPDDPEGGWYWAVVGSQMNFPSTHRHWGDMIVVGRVAGLASGKEPILNIVYARGWGVSSAHDGVWEHLVDANYVPYLPVSAVGEGGQ